MDFPQAEVLKSCLAKFAYRKCKTCELACPRQANAAEGWHVRFSIPPNRHDEAFDLTSMTATLFLKPGGHFPKGQVYNDSGAQLTSPSYTRAHTPFEGVGIVPENQSLCRWSIRVIMQCACTSEGSQQEQEKCAEHQS